MVAPSQASLKQSSSATAFLLSAYCGQQPSYSLLEPSETITRIVIKLLEDCTLCRPSPLYVGNLERTHDARIH